MVVEGKKSLADHGGKQEENLVFGSVEIQLVCFFPFTLPSSPSQLKSEWELDKIKGLKLEELWLDRNPMCDTFRDQSTYIRSVVASVSPPGDIHPLGG